MKTTIRILLLCSLSLIKTDISYAQWVYTDLDSVDVRCVALSSTNLFAGSFGNGIFLSTDNGTKWTAVNSGLTTIYVVSLTIIGENLFAGTYGAGVFLSTNQGANWIPASSGLTNLYIPVLAASGTNLFAGTNSGIFLSTNYGANWTPINSSLPGAAIHSLALRGTEIIIGTSGYGVFRSTNNGTNWIPAGFPGLDVISLAVIGTNIFAGTQTNGLHISTNNGTNWIQVLNVNYVSDLKVVGTNLFVARSGGVDLSTNGGIQWTSVNSGLMPICSALEASGTTLYVGTEGRGVLRRPLSEMITSVKLVSPVLPANFDLAQNYPNPFNPTTSITFAVPSESFVSLKVFDELGKEVTDLISEKLPAGMYAKQWNALGLASGVYLYRLRTGDFVKTRKLLLLK